MVSFQCDSCSDVVKKPKLDQHSGRCRAPFTCLDCSQTFRNSNEWKGHTTCISEAEKYERTLYQGASKKQKQKAKDPYAANFAALQAKQKAEKEAAAAPVIPAPAPVVEKAKVAEVVAEKKEEGGDVNKVEKKRLKAEKKAAKEAKKAAKEVVVEPTPAPAPAPEPSISAVAAPVASEVDEKAAKKARKEEKKKRKAAEEVGGDSVETPVEGGEESKPKKKKSKKSQDP